MLYDIQLLKSKEGIEAIKFFYKRVRSSSDVESFNKNIQFMRNKKLCAVQFSLLLEEEEFLEKHGYKKIFGIYIQENNIEVFSNKKMYIYKILGNSNENSDLSTFLKTEVILDKIFYKDEKYIRYIYVNKNSRW